jgi:hypothetical protein
MTLSQLNFFLPFSTSPARAGTANDSATNSSCLSLLAAGYFSLLILASPHAAATTLLGMDIDQVAAYAELIFEGEVIQRVVRRNDSNGLINTYVTFSILDVIKGNYSADTLELRFTGGSLNGEIVEVSGLVIPGEAEQGVYFVESLDRALLNPILGWSQGHFLIVEEAGERRVTTLEAEAVTSVQAVSTIPSTIKLPQAIIEGKNEVAAGVSTDASELSLGRALTVDQFKSRIRSLLEN